MDRTPGRIAYEAYCGSTGGVSAITGNRLPEYQDQAAPIVEAWEAAARAVLTANVVATRTP